MKSLLVTSLLSAGLVFGALGASEQQTNGKLKLGDPIPAVAAKDQDGKVIDLGESKTGYTLVYFYPKAMTAGCTAQACSLRDSYTLLHEKGVKLFGVSDDTVEAQKELSDKDHLPFKLLQDPDRKVMTA